MLRFNGYHPFLLGIFNFSVSNLFHLEKQFVQAELQKTTSENGSINNIWRKKNSDTKSHHPVLLQVCVSSLKFAVRQDFCF